MDDEDQADTATNPSKWHKNTVKVLKVLQTNLAEQESVSYKELSHGVTRRTAAGVFFEILQLKTLDFIEVNQPEAEGFGDIVISAGARLDEPPPEA